MHDGRVLRSLFILKQPESLVSLWEDDPEEGLKYARGNPCKTRGRVKGWRWTHEGPADEREGIGVHQEPGDQDPHHHKLGAHGTEQPRHPYAEITCVINQDSATGRNGKVRE